MERATFVLEEYRSTLDRMATALKDDETLEDAALQRLLESVPVRPDLLQNGSAAFGNGSAGATRAGRAKPKSRL